MSRARQRPYRRQALVELLLAIAACARQSEGARPSFTPGRGRFVWTDSTSHDTNRPAYHIRCGSALHVWVRDTLSPLTSTHMVIGVLGFEGIAHVVPAYPDFSRRFPQPEWAHGGLYSADNTELATVLGQLRFDSVTVNYVAGQLSGRLVRHTQWDQKPDTSGTLVLDFRAPRWREMEQYLCEGPRM